MSIESVLIYVGGFIIIFVFSALAVRTERKMWRRIQRKGGEMREQREITMGKSHSR
jgi:hypothetical protein